MNETAHARRRITSTSWTEAGPPLRRTAKCGRLPVRRYHARDQLFSDGIRAPCKELDSGNKCLREKSVVNSPAVGDREGLCSGGAPPRPPRRGCPPVQLSSHHTSFPHVRAFTCE